VLKTAFSHSKWVLQAILSLTTLKTVFLAVQALTPLFRLLERKFNEDFTNVLTSVIFPLQVTSNFIPDCAQKLQKSRFRKVFLQNWIQNVFLRFITVILTVVT